MPRSWAAWRPRPISIAYGDGLGHRQRARSRLMRSLSVSPSTYLSDDVRVSSSSPASITPTTSAESFAIAFASRRKRSSWSASRATSRCSHLDRDQPLQRRVERLVAVDIRRGRSAPRCDTARSGERRPVALIVRSVGRWRRWMSQPRRTGMPTLAGGPKASRRMLLSSAAGCASPTSWVPACPMPRQRRSADGDAAGRERLVGAVGDRADPRACPDAPLAEDPASRPRTPRERRR